MSAGWIHGRINVQRQLEGSCAVDGRAIHSYHDVVLQLTLGEFRR